MNNFDGHIYTICALCAFTETILLDKFLFLLSSKLYSFLLSTAWMALKVSFFLPDIPGFSVFFSNNHVLFLIIETAHGTWLSYSWESLLTVLTQAGAVSALQPSLQCIPTRSSPT